jgi:hypothetical protein
MRTRLSILYDEIGDILRFDMVKPNRRQECIHLAPDVLGRLNTRTGAIENIEILFFTERRWRGKALALPVLAEMRRSARAMNRRRNGVRTRRSRKQ